MEFGLLPMPAMDACRAVEPSAGGVSQKRGRFRYAQTMDRRFPTKIHPRTNEGLPIASRSRRAKRTTSKVQIAIDGAIYALRTRVEQCFNRLKKARRVATRYDKPANAFLDFIHLIAVRLWLRHLVNATRANQSLLFDSSA